MNLLATLTVTQDDYDAVHLVVAKREGTFDESDVVDWEQYCRTRSLGSFSRQPNLPRRFPRITIDLVGGDEPGIQVCDLVLWAIQRAALESLNVTGNDDWLKRLRVDVWSGGGPVGGAQEQVSATIGAAVERHFLPTLGGGKPRKPEELGRVELLKVMREIEADVSRVATMAPGHPRVGHLANELAEAAELLKGKIGNAGVLKVAEAFALCCDTLPIYDPTDAAAYVRILERRRVAAAVMDQTQVRWFTLAHFWSQSRLRP
ncbi:MAG: hypothetical protein QM723_27540 [Myxococcaceae bacterium]